MMLNDTMLSSSGIIAQMLHEQKFNGYLDKGSYKISKGM